MKRVVPFGQKNKQQKEGIPGVSWVLTYSNEHRRDGHDGPRVTTHVAGSDSFQVEI